MHKVVSYILVALILAGCGRSVDVRLARVNALAEENLADSAMQVLDSIDMASLSGEYNRRYYDLLTIKTRDKADLSFESDSLALSVMEYFKDHGTDTVRAEAYYYAGRVARMLGDSPQALDYMQSALDCLDDSCARLKGKISSQMGQILLNLYLFEQAKPRFKDAIKYNHASGDTLALMYNYRNLADTHSYMCEEDSVIPNLKLALSVFKKLDSCSKWREIEIRTITTDFYLSKNDLDAALFEYNIIDSLITNESIPDYVLLTAINIHLKTKKLDRARDYSLMLLKSKSIYSKKNAYEALANISDYFEDKENMYLYTRKYKEFIDSINDNASTDAVIHQNSIYNYKLKEQKNLLLEKKQDSLIISVLSLVIIVSALVMITYFIYKHLKSRNKKLLAENNNLLSANNLQKLELSQQLIKIKQLESDIHFFSANLFQNETTAELLSEQIRNTIKEHSKNIEAEKYTVPLEILDSDIYKRLKQYYKDKTAVPISNDEWKSFDNLINTVHVNFKLKLIQLNSKLTEHEYHICLLLKCRFANSEIAFLTHKDKTSISQARKRLYKKMFLCEGESSEFDKFIYSL